MNEKLIGIGLVLMAVSAFVLSGVFTQGRIVGEKWAWYVLFIAGTVIVGMGYMRKAKKSHAEAES